MLESYSPISLDAPFFLLLPVVILLLLALSLKKTPSVVSIPSKHFYKNLQPNWRVVLRRPLLGTLFVTTLIALSIAASRPYQTLTVIEDKSRKNLMLVLDVSESMAIRDFKIQQHVTNRLEAVKGVVASFVKKRNQDRLGLVVFGSAAYLQIPLTLDHDLVLEILAQLQPGIAGNGTAIGDGLGLGVKRIEQIAGESRAIILLTDGVNNSGKVNPVQAAKIARQLHIKVHTIGVGSILERDFDEKTLKKIAHTTGGVYFNAKNSADLQKVYEEINKLETSTEKERQHDVRIEHYWQFALLALGSYLLLLLFSRTVFLITP
jgi:Ca-activated chloride channel homolog